MKISGDDPLKTYLREIRPIEKGESVKKAKQKAASETDRVEISVEAKGYQQVYRKVNAMSDVRTERVSEIQQRIERGEYQINPEKVAEKVVRSAILDAVL